MPQVNDIERQKVEIAKDIRYQFEVITALLEIVVSKSINVKEAEEIVTKRRRDEKKYIKIYNACDGKKSQAEIIKKFKIDQGTLSRAIDNWQSNGILIKLEKNAKVYPKALAFIK